MGVQTASERLVPFVAGFESPGGKAVTRAYRCPAGVITVGHGFTMQSRVFSAWWLAKHGSALKLGDTITWADADYVLARILREEYSPPVADKIGPLPQHQHDGGTSVNYNCGPRSLGWNWAQSLKAGKVPEAARLLRTTAVTANGRKLAGLVRRRAAEAQLIQHGIYADAPDKPLPAEIQWVQESLIKLGYDVGIGGADGRVGKATTDAIRAFQADNKLVTDGIAGPATRATLIRALDAKIATQGGVGAGAGAGTAGGATGIETVEPSAWGDFAMNAAMWGLAAVAVVAIAFVLWRFRGRLTGRRVPT